MVSIVNAEFHNLYKQTTIIKTGAATLLGLGINFCIEQARPYQNMYKALLNFGHKIYIYCWHNNNNNVLVEDKDFIICLLKITTEI